LITGAKIKATAKVLVDSVVTEAVGKVTQSETKKRIDAAEAKNINILAVPREVKSPTFIINSSVPKVRTKDTKWPPKGSTKLNENMESNVIGSVKDRYNPSSTQKSHEKPLSPSRAAAMARKNVKTLADKFGGSKNSGERTQIS
jgi:hypothetical protein